MFVRPFKSVPLSIRLFLIASSSAVAIATDDGIIRVKSGYPIGETIDRLNRISPPRESNSSAKSISRSLPPMPALCSSHPCC